MEEEIITDPLEEQKPVDEICLHILYSLFRDKNRLWRCNDCGVFGTIGSDLDGRLKYTVQPNFMNRARRREAYKEFVKDNKRRV